MADTLAAARENLPRRSATYPQYESNQHATYRVAHSARCKLSLAANRPDRNLRFVLGHAFTLDNVLLRIVEIENHSAKEDFDTSKPTGPEKAESEYANKTSKIGGGAGVQVGEQGSFAKPQEPQSGPRRISFSSSSHFSPSSLMAGQSNSGSNRKRNKSPPPVSRPDNEDSASSDDDIEDPNDFARSLNPKSAIPASGKAANAHDSDSYSDDDYDDDEEEDTGLQRFASAAAQAPRQPSPPAEHVPDLEEDEGDEEDEIEPVSPPSLPEENVRDAMAGSLDDASMDLYNGIKRCPCHHHHNKVPQAEKMWEVKTGGIAEAEGRRFAVMRA